MFAAGKILLLFGVLFLASYFLVNSISHSTDELKENNRATISKNAEIQPVTPVPSAKRFEFPRMQIISIHELHQQIHYLEIAEEIERDLNSNTPISMCEVICKPSPMDNDELSENKMQYLSSFFKAQGRLAFEDPVFRNTLESVGILGRMYPKSLRKLILEMNEIGQMSEMKKISFSARLPFIFVSELKYMVEIFPKLKQRINQAKSYSKLMQSCEGENVSAIVQECYESASQSYRSK
ncbi:MAG: hypothetical protein H7328_07655 [Bdellovibrio sp.]|nr:hypothetical protein [Bdellovibrio sp.]